MSIDHRPTILSLCSNSLLSEQNFRQSCELILPKTKRFEARSLNSILAHDDPDKPLIDDGKHIYIWYFAIGSMINPISSHLRDLTPLISYPAKCPNYQLVFRKPNGMADIKLRPGEDFHGVVHLLPIEQMFRLDQVEHMYRRMIVEIIDYQQRSHLVYVYQMHLLANEERAEGIPSERYLDIIVKGCEHFGVCSLYVNRLKNQQLIIPRKLPTAYQSFDNIPVDVYYTDEDLRKHDGQNPNLPLWISINGKILEYRGLPSIEHPDHENQKRFYAFILSHFAGREVAHGISRAWYEPMYRIPLNDEDLCDEHRALAEDMCVTWGLNSNEENSLSYWKPIGRIVQLSEN